ncbi:hypothetical protein [Pseudomonas migulae]|uniref:Uncharacterized protein n=1 Tax=Pseudomonas migulae TaxID=78543 RepID=A0ABY8MY63_9PSED|nr:hypothetical protein [Pseudomonas migulae]WGK91346.1 hypothetical protein MOQ58_03925 [Pseudomonas migulae]
MTQQIGTFTTGELSASIEGCGEFNARNVEFMGSTDEPDFLLRGMDASRGLLFYFPRFESGHYVLGAGSANKAFYEVDGALNGEVKKGGVDVTVDAEDAVSISFDLWIADKAGDAVIRIKGSGNFKGRVPWTDNGRALSNVICGCLSPKGGQVESDLTMRLDPCEILLPAANTTISPFHLFSGKANPGAKVNVSRLGNGAIIHGSSSADGNGDWKITPDRALPVGSIRMHARQIMNDVVSYSEEVNYTVNPLAPPVITTPKEGESLYFKGSIRGTGHPGAKVTVHKNGDAYTLYGRADVPYTGIWSAPIELPLGPFTMTAKQNFDGVDSGWAVPVSFKVTGLPGPRIKVPVSGEHFRYNRNLSGEGSPGAEIKLYKVGDSSTVYGRTQVNARGEWSTVLGIRPPVGHFSIMGVQTLNNVTSQTNSVTFMVIP